MASKEENLKKKKNVLSVKQRCEIIQRLNSGSTGKSLAAEYNVSKQTISWIKRNQESILKTKNILDNCDGNVEKKRYTGQEEKLLDRKLLTWFYQQRNMGRPIPNTILKKQAVLFNKRLNGKENFEASDGWVRRFKIRYGLKRKKIHGEKLSADREGSEYFKEKINNMIQVTGMSLDFIYNCDETALYWRLMLNSTLVGKNEMVPEGHKKPKNRVTVMTCTNASGTHKVSLLVIGKSAQPRCFKGVENLPLHYTHEENAWMTSDIMRKWYTEVFLPEIKSKHDLHNNPQIKIILIMDNAACHPPAEELNKLCEAVTVMYLPPNVTSLIQPLDQGIIEKFKRRYWHDLMVKMLIEDENKNPEDSDFLKNFNILYACTLCRLAWDAVTSTDIRHCWKNLIPLTVDNPEEISPVNNEDFYSIMRGLDQFKSATTEKIDRWLQIDYDDHGWQPLTDDDILADRSSPNRSVVQELDDEISYSDQNWSIEDSIADDQCPTFIEAVNGLNVFLKYYQIKGDSADNFFNIFLTKGQEFMEKGIKEKLSCTSRGK